MCGHRYSYFVKYSKTRLRIDAMFRDNAVMVTGLPPSASWQDLKVSSVRLMLLIQSSLNLWICGTALYSSFIEFGELYR